MGQLVAHALHPFSYSSLGCCWLTQAEGGLWVFKATLAFHRDGRDGHGFGLLVPDSDSEFPAPRTGTYGA